MFQRLESARSILNYFREWVCDRSGAIAGSMFCAVNRGAGTSHPGIQAYRHTGVQAYRHTGIPDAGLNGSWLMAQGKLHTPTIVIKAWSVADLISRQATAWRIADCWCSLRKLSSDCSVRTCVSKKKPARNRCWLLLYGPPELNKARP